MLFKKKNQMKDERIEKETNKLMTPMFYLFSVGLLASLIVKLVLKEPWYNFILELLCLVPGWGYALVKRIGNGVLFLREKDEVLLSIRDGIMAKAYMLMFWILTVGQLLYMFFVLYALMPEDVIWVRGMTWLVVYLAIDLIPAFIITIFSIKKGWMVWGSQKREVAGKKNFVKSTIVASLFFGLVMGVPQLFVDGIPWTKAVMTIIGSGAAWGIMFYFGMLAVIKISEKNADKFVKEKEESNEE